MGSGRSRARRGVPLIALAVVGVLETTGMPGGRGAVESAASLVPSLAELFQARLALLGVMAGIIVYLHAKALLRRDRWVLLAAVPLGLLAPLSAATVTDAGSAAIVAAIGIPVCALVAWWLLRANLAAYMLGALMFGLLGGVVGLTRTNDEWLVGNGLALAVISVLVAVAIVWWGRRGPNEQPAVRTAEPAADDAPR